MGLLTREEEKRFPREREILTTESSKGTEDNNSRPPIPPQTTTQGPVAVLIKVPADGTVEPLKEGTEMVSPNSLSLERTRSAGSEEVLKPKTSEELVKELTLSDEILEQVVAQIAKAKTAEEDLHSKIAEIAGLQTVKWLKLDSLERQLMSTKASGSVGQKQIVEIVKTFPEGFDEVRQNVELEILNVLRRLGAWSSSDDAVTVTSDGTATETDSPEAVEILELPL
ncbi:hypothetical protein AXG93_2836s1020 [Marchantia polymorpha subsp. ruderalis]|uniref:Uncharacterized protein n=1 Tax=Marchantia polymorpha subsp. ruderalis TaxID=1480154 RepID=A0A176VUJ4_MARPO|nr:hypothetical protein AXG93_2836s1020 [Marchantia polymorpha subsp. ruderalis]